MPESILKQFCIPENRVRNTYYSDTYRAEFSVGNQNGVWDVTHISIPFCVAKEEYLKEYYGLSKDELTAYYEKFSAHLTNSINLIASIHNMGNSDLSGNFVKYVYNDIIPKPDRGSDIYLVSEPVDPIIGSDYFINDTVTLQNLLSLCTRVTQTIKLLDGTGIHIGAVDLRSLGLCSSGDKQIIKFTSLLYGYKDKQPSYSLLPTTPPTIANMVQNGFAPSTYTDTVSIAMLVWRLGGGISEDISTMPVERPQYLPDNVVSILKSITSVEPANDFQLVKDVHKNLYSVIRHLKTTPEEDITIPLYFTEPPPAEDEPEVIPQATEPQYDFGIQKKESSSLPPPLRDDRLEPPSSKAETEPDSMLEAEQKVEEKPQSKSKSSSSTAQSKSAQSKNSGSKQSSGTKQKTQQSNKSTKSPQSVSNNSAQKSGSSNKSKAESNASVKKPSSQSGSKQVKKEESEKNVTESDNSKKIMVMAIIAEFLILTGAYIGLMIAMPEQMIEFIRMLQNLF